MLGTRTKQIYSYGKRNQRIVNTSEDRDQKDIFMYAATSTIPRAPVASRMRKREDFSKPVKSRSPASHVIKIQRKKKQRSLIPSSPADLKTIEKEGPVQNVTKGDINTTNSTRPVIHTVNINLTTPPRPPLRVYPLNIPASSAGDKVRKKPKVQKVGLQKAFSPFVDVEILVLDEDGRRISQERRVSRKDFLANPIDAEPSRVGTGRLVDEPKREIQVICVSDEEPCVLQPKRVIKRAKKKVVVSDASEPDEDTDYEPPLSVSKSSRISSRVVQPPRPRSSRNIESDNLSPPVESVCHSSQVSSMNTPPPPDPPSPSTLESGSESSSASVVIIPTQKTSISRSRPHRIHASSPAPSHVLAPRYQHFPLPLPRTRQLTPIRNGAGTRSRLPFGRPPLPSPSTPSDTDLSFDISDTDLDFASLQLSDPYSKSLSTGMHVEFAPEYLRPILTECGQQICGPHEFSAFITTFPVDAIVWDSPEKQGVEEPRFRKIGEASYSEVFGIGDVVLKIIPLRDEAPKGNAKGPTPTQARGSSKSTLYGMAAPQIAEGPDDPPPTDAKDVLKEMIVTRAMGGICEGFVKLLRTYIVRGRYPELLLELWDDYFERKGSENIRPGMLSIPHVTRQSDRQPAYLLQIPSMPHNFMLSLSCQMVDRISKHTHLQMQVKTGGCRLVAAFGK